AGACDRAVCGREVADPGAGAPPAFPPPTPGRCPPATSARSSDSPGPVEGVADDRLGGGAAGLSTPDRRGRPILVLLRVSFWHIGGFSATPREEPSDADRAAPCDHRRRTRRAVSPGPCPHHPAARGQAGPDRAAGRRPDPYPPHSPPAGAEAATP